MRKFLSGAALSATVFAANMAPAFANPTNINTGYSVTVNSVAPKSNLVEIDGRILTDAEAAKVEGQIFWKAMAVGAVWGAGSGLASTTVACYRIPGAKCGWQEYAGGTAFGAAKGAFFRR